MNREKKTWMSERAEAEEVEEAVVEAKDVGGASTTVTEEGNQ